MGDRLPWERPLGAIPEQGGPTTFRVSAARAREVSVELGGRAVASRTTSTRSSPTPPARGRRRELAAFVGFGQEVPDPKDPATADRSLLDHANADRELSGLDRRLPALHAGLPQADAEVAWEDAAAGAPMRRGRGGRLAQPPRR